MHVDLYKTNNGISLLEFTKKLHTQLPRCRELFNKIMRWRILKTEVSIAKSRILLCANPFSNPS
jgi:hypothetical protein